MDYTSPFSSPIKTGMFGAGLASMAMPLFSDKPDFINPSSAAAPYLNQIPGTIKPYLDPYINRGNEAANQLNPQYGQALHDPSGLLKSLSNGYTQSPGYEFKLSQALNAANNAAASGGMAGSPQHQQQSAQIANNVASGDYEDWLNHILSLYGIGLSGEEGFNKQGFEGSNNLSTSLANALGSQASLAYQGAGQQNAYNQAEEKSDSDMWGNIGGLISLAAFL